MQTFIYFHLPNGSIEKDELAYGTSYAQYKLGNQLYSVGIVEAETIEEAQKYMDSQFGNGYMKIVILPKPNQGYRHRHLIANNHCFI